MKRFVWNPCGMVQNDSCGNLVRLSDAHAAIAELRAEHERLSTLARDAYVAWSTDRDARVGKLLRAMVDAGYCRTYRPDLMPNANSTSGDAENHVG